MMNFGKIIGMSFLLLTSYASYAQWSKRDFDKLELIIGTWVDTSHKLTEVWERKNDSLYVGRCLKLEGDKKYVQEFCVLGFYKDKILYTPNVFHNNKPDTANVIFELISNKGNRYIFENKNHDFPQQIIYHFKKDGSLDASINGTTKDGFKQYDFPYKKLKD